ncbi:GT2 family glycosyltransferase [Flavobacterium sp. CG_23.5]|uniref:glycosyltransferase n=1 Tax=Flavobacterium sp. CG_23.5 TaxID=2760708 RepID=UPI001EC83B5D|nr:glycosyltransferase [Flavobacterium sp. CG_23.5]MBP2283038.1 GT2 family glycosyltransferase [Flavobacterium sp. CG_23.5]
MCEKKISILISTKNRREDLIVTLRSIEHLLVREDLECRIYDDGSNDGTFDYVKHNYPNISIQRNSVSKGYMYCRNTLLNQTKAKYAISLDDDAHFITQNPLELIQLHFDSNPKCGLIAFRIFWGAEQPASRLSNETVERVQSFVGCAHAWRIEAWKEIPNYPEWFVFYGEEDFASYQLFKKGWEVHYLPKVLVNHRVEMKSRKKNIDYSIRLQRSLRAGWYLFFLFYPIQKTPRVFFYSVWKQLQLKVFKGDFKALQALFLASIDLVFSIPNIIRNSNRLTSEEFKNYKKLAPTKIYWTPSD